MSCSRVLSRALVCCRATFSACPFVHFSLQLLSYLLWLSDCATCSALLQSRGSCPAMCHARFGCTKGQAILPRKNKQTRKYEIQDSNTTRAVQLSTRSKRTGTAMTIPEVEVKNRCPDSSLISKVFQALLEPPVSASQLAFLGSKPFAWTSRRTAEA